MKELRHRVRSLLWVTQWIGRAEPGVGPKQSGSKAQAWPLHHPAYPDIAAPSVWPLLTFPSPSLYFQVAKLEHSLFPWQNPFPTSVSSHDLLSAQNACLQAPSLPENLTPILGRIHLKDTIKAKETNIC